MPQTRCPTLAELASEALIPILDPANCAFMPKNPQKPSASKGIPKSPRRNGRNAKAPGIIVPPLREYPEELVASVAAQLLKDDNWDRAVTDAFCLLATVSEKAKVRKTLDEIENPPNAFDLQKAIFEITTNKDREHSQENYREFLYFMVSLKALSRWPPPRRDKKQIEEWVDAEYAHQKARGLGRRHIDLLKGVYGIWQEVKKRENKKRQKK